MTPTDKDEDRVLRLERRLNAPPAAAFAAWTDPTRLARWWGPENFEVPLCELDPRPGGRWETCMRSPDGTAHYVGGVYREVTAPERLVFTWAWRTDGVPGHETLVTVEFHPDGDGTRLVLVQEAFDSAQSRDDHRQGWTSSLICLGAALAAR